MKLLDSSFKEHKQDMDQLIKLIRISIYHRQWGICECVSSIPKFAVVHNSKRTNKRELNNKQNRKQNTFLWATLIVNEENQS